MEIKPVRKYMAPEYPTREQFDDEWLELLRRVPQGWINRKITAGTLLALFTMGPGWEMRASGPADDEAFVSSPEETGPQETAVQKKKAVRVAPLFIHGDGSGATGCVVVSPPAFLTEAEAVDLVLVELKRQGLDFEKADWLMDNIPAEFDLYSQNLKMGITIVGLWNYEQFGGEKHNSTVIKFDFVAAAQQYIESLRSDGNVNAALLYDPLEDRMGGRPVLETAGSSKKLLLEQVRAFVGWLKREGGAHP
jgi:hypothetical protein